MIAQIFAKNVMPKIANGASLQDGSVNVELSYVILANHFQKMNRNALFVKMICIKDIFQDELIGKREMIES